MTCLSCDPASGRVPLPGGLVHETRSWRVGPLGAGALVLEPTRHVTHLAELDAAEQAELGPLLRRTAAVVAALVDAEQVHACIGSPAGSGHLRVVVRPGTAASVDVPGSALQVAPFEDGPGPPAVEEFRRRAQAAFRPPPVPGGLLSVPHAEASAAFLAGLRAFVDAVSDLDERELLTPSRCTGWTAGDVAVHVQLGLQEMLLGVVSRTDDPPDTDAATYWRSFPPAADAGPEMPDHTRFVRLLSSAYLRPSAPVAHLRTTAAALRSAVAALAEGAVAFQGHVLATGDFLATWAVELAVHHLDIHGEPDPSALGLARRTVEALAAATAPDVDDTTLVLAGTGRVPSEIPGLPVLG